MNQIQIESLTDEEYSHFLSFGEPVDKGILFGPNWSTCKNTYQLNFSTNMSMGIDSDSCLTLDWIGTLESQTYPGSTFGYLVLKGS